MVEVELVRTIDRPIEEVFARLADIDRYAEWLPRSRVFLDCRVSSDGPVRLGTTYTRGLFKVMEPAIAGLAR